MRALFAFLAGGLFGAGLLVSGMTDTSKVQGWLDVFGNWDPTLAFVMGVPWSEAAVFGNLLGTKIAINEFVGYIELVTAAQNGSLSPRSVVIGTYALCGFANFASIAIQIGGIGTLAPERRSAARRARRVS